MSLAADQRRDDDESKVVFLLPCIHYVFTIPGTVHEKLPPRGEVFDPRQKIIFCLTNKFRL